MNVQKLKNKLVSENKKVTWVPEHVGSGRFNNGLQIAPDWAISRSRYWGAPLPVWRNSKTKEIKVIGSVDELLSLTRRSGNKYFVMRHGEARSNNEKVLDGNGDMTNHLTEDGRREVSLSAKLLKEKKIDLMIVSPLLRARETASIVQKELRLPNSSVMVDERLREVGFGIFDGKTHAEWYAAYGSLRDRFASGHEGGESFTDIRRRMGEFIFDIERRYVGKNILIVSHGNPLWLLTLVVNRIASREAVKETLLNKAEAREISFIPFPHNADYELDLHRPYIDEVPLGDSLSGGWKRVPDVFDCWFESGSMPFASNHYPFEKKNFDPKRLFGFLSKGYPADFIAESIDQTRGWFYSLIVLGVGLFGTTPYKAVVTNGLMLAEDGRKMSKKLKNYPDPMELVERYGADALRYYLLSSPVIRGEDLRFKTQGVEEVTKKLIMRLDNVKSFYELYVEAKQKDPEKSLGGGAPNSRSEFGDKDFLKGLSAEHVLDRWILSRLGQLIAETTDGFENYELDGATRPLADFIDDLSTWYLRRSRGRFKEEGVDKAAALETLRHVLYTVAHVMAPSMPFFAEYLYQSVQGEGDPESVHLCAWPSAGAIDAGLLSNMQEVRKLASQALQIREKQNIKLRQPLNLLEISKALPGELTRILAEEVNVKEIRVDPTLEQNEKHINLDFTLTPELKEEGLVRNVMRTIQEQRKEQRLNINDRPELTITLSDEETAVAKKHLKQIIADTGLASLKIEVK